ncbi:MAG: hypothetical protein ACKO4Y_10090 [Flavobacteriales bacterium]
MSIFRLTCAHLNELFSSELANEKHQGEETPDNHKYHWEDELEVRDIASHELNEDGVYVLKGEHPTLGNFAYDVPGVFLLTIGRTDGSQVQFAVSKQLIQEVIRKEFTWGVHVLIELKDNEPFANPITGIYIANHDFPNQLIGNATD